MLFESTQGAINDAGITKDEIDAAWLGVYYFTGVSGTTLEDSLRLGGKPVTRVENYCASGMESIILHY